jgi:hypothetical protein
MTHVMLLLAAIIAAGISFFLGLWLGANADREW